MRALVVALAALAAAPVRVLAAPEPWDVGVSDDNQARAEAIFAEGNQLFSQRAHAPALAKYKEAIALWDHPMIRFNMAVTLIRLDRILEAADELDAALRYGPAPFTPELYQQALDFQTLVRKQLGYIEAVSDQAGTRILLDGKPWFEAPGTRKIRVDRRKIDLDVIKRIGRYSIPVHVFEDVTAEVKTLVVPEGGELPPEEELEALEAAERAEAEAAAASHTDAVEATGTALADEETDGPPAQDDPRPERAEASEHD